MAETFGRVRRQMIDVVEPAVGEEAVDSVHVGHAALDEPRGAGNVVVEAAGQIVEYGDVVPAEDQRVGDVRPDEARAAGDENAAHDCQS